MDYRKELYKILEDTYLANQKVLEVQNDELLDDPNFSNLYQAYSIANNKLKNALDLFQILLDDDANH
jgi:D-serine dehydratase